MKTEEAKQYVDLVIEELVTAGIINPDTYGKMTENQTQHIVEMVVKLSEE